MNEGRQPLSLEEVTAWLRVNRYGAAALELFSEVERRRGERYLPLLEVAEATREELSLRPTGGASPIDTGLSVTSPSSSSAMMAPAPLGLGERAEALREDALAKALGECLEVFKAAKGADALHRVLTDGGYLATPDVPTAQPLNPCPPPPPLLPRADPCNEALEEGELAVLLPRRLQETEAQLKQFVAMVTDSLATLLTAVDPAKKEALLPLLRSVAILADSSTSRAAARHAMLHLFKRPTDENRNSITAEWLRVTQAVPRRTVEQEVIPELYGLVNARTPERRLLALDCALAVAEQIQDAYKVRYALCQGLLRPLSEDESSAVRRQVPVCLAALWGGGAQEGGAVAAAALRTTNSGSGPGASSSADVTSAPLSHQSTFPMELAVRLAIDPFSNSVRRAAQTQLREAIYPKCFRDGALLSAFVPLLMTFVGMEVGPLRMDDSLPSSTPTKTVNTAPNRASRPAAKKAPAAPATPTAKGTSAAALTYSNVVMLVKLCGDAVQCAKAHLDLLRDGAGPVEGAAPSTSAFDVMASSVTDAYVRVVLPTAYTLLPALLNTFGSAAGTHPLVVGPLCGLGAALAGLVPALNPQSWERVKTYLLASVQPSSAARFAGGVPRLGDELPEARGRLMLLYIVLTRLAGEQSAFHERQQGAASSLEKAAAGAGKASGHGGAAKAFGNEVGQQSALLILQSLGSPLAVPLSTDERMRLLALCLGQLGALSFGENDRLSAGVVAVLWSFAESAAATQRLHVVSLVTQVCAQPLEDAAKVSFVCPPLFALLNDSELAVQEMVVKGLLTVAAGLTQPAAQEKLLRPTLAMVEASGCTSDLTFAALHQWETLLGTMPAEPREAFLYPQLNVLMDMLSNQQTRRMLVLQERRLSASTPKSNSRAAALSPEEQSELKQWERVMSVLLSLLAAILRCAVVTPPLVAKHLMPGIRHLASGGALTGVVSPQLRARWEHLTRSYETFMEHNSALAATQQAANLISRVRDELKRRF